MSRLKQNRMLIAIASTGPISVYGAYSMSQTIALARKPILVQTSPDAPSTILQLGREGQSATSATQDLELTRQIILAYFDAIDAAHDARDNDYIEVPTVAYVGVSSGFDVASAVVNEFTNDPELISKGVVDSIHSDKKSAWHVLYAKGKSVCGHITRSLGIKRGQKRATTAS
mmetsp:Transcript_9570/g.17975  ORF Transcript_9570/g.17975 Transcript_9570/m.17975 type:complete len:172 (-) Transcript_9570:148-663(-)